MTSIVDAERVYAKRRADIRAFFDHPGMSNGATEDTNDRLEHPRGATLGFHKLTNYIRRAVLNTASFSPTFHRRLGKSCKTTP